MADMFHNALLILNFDGDVRYDNLDGRRHAIVPATSMEEGVWSGNQGPVFYGEDEFGRTVDLWNMKPVVVDHPTDDGGKHISACLPHVINTRGIGVLMNTRWDGKLRHDFWIDEDKCRRVDARIMRAIETKTPMEVSTGMYADGELLQNEATHERSGKKYKRKARNLRPDHVAILPDCVGAYSISDGGGLFAVNQMFTNMREPEGTGLALGRSMIHALKAAGIVQLTANELSHTAIASQLSDLLGARFGEKGKYWRGHIESVYTDRVIFYKGDDWRDLYMLKYTVKDDVVKLSEDEPTRVERVVEYRGAGVKLTANTAGGLIEAVSLTANEDNMNKEQMITGLIGNKDSGFSEADRAFLNGKDEAWVKKMWDRVNPPAPQTPNPAPQVPNPNPNPLANAGTQTPAPGVYADPVAYINAAPPGVREYLEDLRNNGEAEKAKLVAKIKADPRNTLSEDTLKATPIANLRYIAGFLEPVKPATPPADGTGTPPANGLQPLFGNGAQPLVNFAGAEGAAPLANNAPAPTTYLELPEMPKIDPFATAAK